MGQKVHPEAMRVGYIHDWKSNWFNERQFSDFLIEDVRIRDHITGKLAHAGLSDITIRKDAAEVEVNIHTARPGIVIGRKGQEADNLRAAQTGDDGARRVLSDAGTTVGRALVPVCTVLDPALVVIGGACAASESLVSAVQNALVGRMTPLRGSPVEVRAGELGDEAEMLGAVTLATQRMTLG